ncbi:MAG TPA: EVE domain-containing protein [Gemmatimonadales bacterium]|nr:EVE domain-containing protein [Gemmatimonadales bacterium]
MPNYWLLKTEPSTYSFDRLVEEGRAVWDGVRNNLALLHLRAMKEGDRVFIYHSGSEKAIIGTARVLSAAYPDPTQRDSKLVVVDIAPDTRLPKPVSLATIKADAALSGMPLVRMPRLSVMPVTAEQWRHIHGLAGK